MNFCKCSFIFCSYLICLVSLVVKVNPIPINSEEITTETNNDILYKVSKCSDLENYENEVSVWLQENDNDFKRIIKSGNSFYNISIGQIFELRCLSRSPAKIKFHGLLANKVINASTTRYSEGVDVLNDICYELKISFKSTSSGSGTGRYECVNVKPTADGLQLIEQEDTSVSAYVFDGADNKVSNLVHASEVSESIPVITEEVGKIILPCYSSNPSISLRLFLENNAREIEMTNENGVIYDLTQGFILSNFTCRDSYICSSENINNSRLRLHVQCKTPVADKTGGIEFKIERKENITKMQFMCNNSLSMYATECTNRMECEFLKSCATYPLNTQDICFRAVGSRSCGNKCKFLQVGYSFIGMIFCSNENGSIAEEAFSDVGGKRAFKINYLTGAAVPKNHVHWWISFKPTKYDTWNNVKDFVLYENARFQCNASKVASAKEIEWLFELKNGTHVHVDTSEEQLSENNGVYSSEANIHFNNSDITALVCRAPKLYSNDWHYISQPIQINPYIPLSMKDFHDESYSVPIDGSSGAKQDLVCTVIGSLDVKIVWRKNGLKGISNFHNIDLKRNNHTTTSLFTSYYDASTKKSDLKDNYSCTAIDVLGFEITKNFQIQWYEPYQYKIVIPAVLGVLVLCIIITSILVSIMKIRDKKHKAEMGELNRRLFNLEPVKPEENSTPKNVYENTQTDKQTSFLHHSLCKEFIIPLSDIDIGGVIDEGNFGKVGIGTLKKDEKTYPVAIKEIKDGFGLKDLENFINEILSWQSIGYHQYIVQFYGVVEQTNFYKSPKIVMEYCEHTNLKNFLMKKKATFQNEIPFEGDYSPMLLTDISANASPSTINSINYSQAEANVRTTHLIQWSYQIASALKHLSDKGFVHRDIAARNILLMGDWTIRLADFGMARNLEKSSDYSNYSNIYKCSQNSVAPVRWLSPEAYIHGKFSVESDIWAFGITLFEIFNLCESHPYSFHTIENIKEKFQELLGKFDNDDYIEEDIWKWGLSKTKYAPPEIYDIMTSCWNLDTKERPTFSELMDALKDAEKSFQKSIKTSPTLSKNSSLGYESEDDGEVFVQDATSNPHLIFTLKTNT